MKIKKLIQSKSGIKLDLGCGGSKQGSDWIGLDRRKVKGVDIVHDITKFPYPLPNNCCLTILMSHLWEHIPPDKKIEMMNELWRIMKVDGQLFISVPYATSFGANQDPTHYPCPNEATVTYFDPNYPLYNIYKPKPWEIKTNIWHSEGNLEVVLVKRDKVKKQVNKKH